MAQPGAYRELAASGGGYWLSKFDVTRQRTTITERYDVELPGPFAYLSLRL